MWSPTYSDKHMLFCSKFMQEASLERSKDHEKHRLARGGYRRHRQWLLPLVSDATGRAVRLLEFHVPSSSDASQQQCQIYWPVSWAACTVVGDTVMPHGTAPSRWKRDGSKQNKSWLHSPAMWAWVPWRPLLEQCGWTEQSLIWSPMLAFINLPNLLWGFTGDDQGHYVQPLNSHHQLVLGMK